MHLQSHIPWCILIGVISADSDSIVRPSGVYVGDQPSSSTVPGCQSFTLKQIGQIATLDYGEERAGHPWFDISSLDNPVQIEVKYTEPFDGLNNVFSDGPYAFASSLANTFRVETFNVTKVGPFQSYFIQGGQRWQSIRLLTAGSVSFSSVGFISSVDTPDVDQLPGHFECSNSAYNEIWKLGARAVSAACVNPGTQTQVWDVTEEGAYIRGQAPSVSAAGYGYVDYRLNFTTKIIRGGSGWAVSKIPNQNGLQMLLVSELPEATTFVNTNRSLTAPNTIAVAYGTSFVNQTTLPSYYIATFPTPFNITEGEWYTITTSILNGTQLSTSINGHLVFDISLADYGISLDCARCSVYALGQGSFGFGPWQDQVALVKDVSITSLINNTVLYQNPMTSSSILEEYGAAVNTANVCLDGAKRDRLVWLGDFYHTTQIIASTTGRSDHVLGTYEWLQEWQIADGEMDIDPPMGYNATYKDLQTPTGMFGLPDYQILGVAAFTEWFKLTGDVQIARKLWPGMKKTLQFLTTNISPSNNLSQIGGFIGAPNGTATSAATVQALLGAALCADALNDTLAATTYRAVAARVADAVNALLWNEQLGVYSYSTASPGNYSVNDIAFAITSGIAFTSTSNTTTTPTKTSSLLAALSALKLSPGYRDSTLSDPAAPSTSLSPNTNGFLLAALAHPSVNAMQEGRYLLDNLWTRMIDDGETYSGASWEYVGKDMVRSDGEVVGSGGPGLGLFTSLSHPWGGAPSYVLGRWVLGVRETGSGGGKWEVRPAVEGWGLQWARGRVGGVGVEWKLGNGSVTVVVDVPGGTRGTVGLAGREELGEWCVDGKRKGSGGEGVEVGGERSEVVFWL
ncbi:is able to hydrolyze alpha-1 protein [Rutstroemia sp. NJR-2017a WRK4]|nr:is able to hydrolyze alpha-1 protein [Rutstroemia sp. NJR-2017a WRK4]PQE14819.1 is able to hydrolyze alpha-1 protein [Rutstroemia sp. NJR-2017a WRK4]